MASRKEKQQIKKLLDAIASLQNDNFQLDRIANNLSLTLSEVNETIVELYIFLDPQNDLGISFENVFDNLDSLIVAIKKLLHEKEVLERKNQYLINLYGGN